MSIHLGDITIDNLKEIIDLDPNLNHATPTIYSLAQYALFDHSKSFINSILLDDVIIGFAMVLLEKDDKLHLQRFMIDKKYQGCGHGFIALNLVVKKGLQYFNANTMYVSTGNPIAEHIYIKYGFIPTDKTIYYDTVIGSVSGRELIYTHIT
jgi:ribosomal protein S18 acetylase RimI-like enzyme